MAHLKITDDVLMKFKGKCCAAFSLAP